MNALMVAALCLAAQPAPPAPVRHRQTTGAITAEMRTEDPRLERRVTLTGPRIYVGELLETLSAQSRVPVSAGERDGAGDVIVSAYLRDVPVANVMNALCSLVSYKGAEWQWARTGAPGSYSYRLVRPLAARQFAERFRQSVQDAFEDEAAAYRAALRLSPRELREHAATDRRLKHLVDSPRELAGLQTLFEAVPPDLQAQVLRGQAKPRLPIDRLTPAGQQFVRSEWKANPVFMAQGDGSLVRAPEPSWIDFDAHRFSTTVAPSLFIHLDGTGFAWIGGVPLERATCKRLADLWMASDDEPSLKQENRRIASPAPGAPSVRDDNPVRLRLNEIADSLPVSIIARLPRRWRDAADIGDPYGHTLAEMLGKLRKSDPQYMIKWRDGVLLMDTPTWVHEENRAPWSIVKRVRKERGDRPGGFSLTELMRLAASLTVDELRDLADEYPVMNGVAQWHDLLAAMDASPLLNSRLSSVRGAALERVLPYLRAANPGNAHALDGAPRGATVTIEQAIRQGVSVVQITVRGPDGRYIMGTGFVSNGQSTRR